MSPIGAPGPLWRTIRATAANHSGRPAVTFLDAQLEAETLSFGELVERVEALAARLALVASPGPVGLLLRRQEDQVLHYLAALAAGLTPSILTPPSPRIDLGWYLRTARAAIHTAGFAAIVTDVPELVDEATTTVLTPWGLEPLADVPGAHPIDTGGAAFLQFSSGTTGAKKGVLIPDDRVLAQLGTYGEAIGLSPDDVIVSWLPLYHDMGFVACLNMPLAAGSHLVLLEPLEWVARPATYLAAVERFRGSLSWHPNFAYALMAQRCSADSLDLSSLRGLVNCSEPATHRSQQAFLDRFEPARLRPDVFWGCYAMAETTFALTHGVTRPDGPAPSVGRALPGVEIDVVGGDGRVCDDGEVGELRVRAPFLADGYVGKHPAGSESFTADGYLTGDLGYRRGELVFVCGRAKDVLIVAGVNVMPHDVEELAGSVPGVKAGRVAAFAVFDDARQTERIVVLCEPEADELEPLTLAEARRRIVSSLGVANVEVRGVAPGTIVKSSSGKVARAENARRFAA